MHISSSVRPAAVLLLVLSGTAFAQTHRAASPATTAKPAPAPVPAAAAPTPAPAPLPGQGLTVLVVDVQSLLENSKAAKMVHGQIEQKRIEYTKEISQEEEALRAERDALQRQQASMSPAILNKKGREFQQKVNDLDRSVQSKRQALEKSNNDALATIQQTMLRIIADIAKERKANLVLQRTDLVLFDRAFDVTDEVMQKLDEELPVLNVNFVNPTPVGPSPAPAPAPAASAKGKRR